MGTSADLLSSIKRRAFWPETGAPFSDTELLAIATEEQNEELLPLVLQAQKEYGVFDTDHSITSGVRDYILPARAHDSKLRDLIYVDTSNREHSMSLVDAEEVTRRAGSASAGGYIASFRDDWVSLFPTPTATSGTLRMRAYMEPGTLIATTSATQVESVSASTRQLDVVNAGVFSANGVGVYFDFVREGGGCSRLAIDMLCTVSAANVMTFSTDLPAGIAAGDWVATRTYSPVPNIPEAAHATLAQRVAAVGLEMRGARDQAAAAMARYEQMGARLVERLASRIDGEPTPIIPHNSPLRAMRAG